MDISLGSCFPHCLDHQLDHLGHHAVMCKGGEDVVLCHNNLMDAFSQFFLVGDKRHSCPADILVQSGKPAAFDLTVTSPLNLTTLTEVGVTRGSAAMVAEVWKHRVNDLKYLELEWP